MRHRDIIGDAMSAQDYKKRERNRESRKLRKNEKDEEIESSCLNLVARKKFLAAAGMCKEYFEIGICRAIRIQLCSSVFVCRAKTLS